MQGKILIIDAISTNRIVLKVKLAGAFYEVLQAGTIKEALMVARAQQPDLVLTALSLPDGTAADLCQHLRKSPHSAHIPILAVGSAPDPATRLATIAAGAFDVMDKPVNETLLLGRVRSMIRYSNTLAEWTMREDTSCALGLAEAPVEFARPGHVTLVGDEISVLKGWAKALAAHMRCSFAVTPLKDAMAHLHEESPSDLVVLALPEAAPLADESLRLISALRASAQTRNIGLLALQQSLSAQKATHALDLGADDLMIAGFDAPELALRLQVLLRRKRQVEKMHQTVRTGLREVVNDPLTGVYNRRYAMPHLAQIMDRSAKSRQTYAVLLADMDHFKRINDLYGHTSGDAVLVESARRLRNTVRGADMVARLGGEEFLILLPNTPLQIAHRIADQLCAAIGERPFEIPGAAKPVTVTVSLGVAMGLSPPYSASGTAKPGAQESVEALLDRADKALYVAKMKGRNCVTLSQPQSRPAA